MLDASRAGIGPLIGRAAEMRTLTALLDGIETGGGALVLRGEPGIGKSRLLAEVSGIAQDRGIAVLTAAAMDLDRWRKAADDALYGAKAAGRNRVTAASEIAGARA